MVHGALGAGTTDNSGEDFVGLHTGGDAGPRVKGCNCAGFFLEILFLEMLPMAYSGSMELNISYGGFQSALP